MIIEMFDCVTQDHWNLKTFEKKTSCKIPNITVTYSHYVFSIGSGG